MTFRGDTIAAIATAPGRGGVAVIRVSGPEAFSVAKAITGKLPCPGKIAFNRLFNVRRKDETAHLIDSGIVLAFKAPHSYTGEDVIEFQCHGGTITPRRILEQCFAAGARLAERGEFTARAFYNGRMPLEAAEGVIELVDAKTDRAADAALNRLDGADGQQYRALYDAAIELSSTIEYALDIDESELPSGYAEGLKLKVSSLRSEIEHALSRLQERRMLRDGALVVLAGPPNAGKSSLLNALLGENRAIVSATPGTTRDTIEVWLDIEGWPVRLVDTAGLRGTDDAIEREGVRRAGDLIARAEVVLALDCTIENALPIHAKCDLDALPTACADRMLRVSAKTGEGLNALRQAIATRLAAKAQRVDEDVCVSDRDLACLTEARAALAQSSATDLVLVANAVRTCAETLGKRLGAVYSDDLLDAIFSRFCVGK